MKAVNYYQREGGNKAILIVKETAKYIRALTFTGKGIQLLRLPSTEARYFTDILFHGKPYPERRALRKFRVAYRKLGGSKGAKTFLYPTNVPRGT
jgi:hypothetical protein